MKLHVFFSVHERIFGPIAERLRASGLVSEVSGFVWGRDQLAILHEAGVALAHTTVFSRDIVAQLDDTPADLAYLAAWEERSGVSLQHMIFAERHLARIYSHDQLLRLAELIFRRAEQDFDRIGPDTYFSEDVACFASYIHWVVARDRGVKIVLVNNARFPGRVTAYANRYQQWDKLDAIFPDTPAGTLSKLDWDEAAAYIATFRERPTAPTGQNFRNKLPLASGFDLGRLRDLQRRYRADPRNPTLRPPAEMLFNRARRLVRNTVARHSGLFEQPRENERYVLFPLHLQPEATTLVLAPYYLNQLALVEDIAKSLPAGVKLYVKDHRVCRGRWPLSFYQSLRAVPGVRLISAEADGFALMRNAEIIASITGTMGWEGILLGKPVVTFGHVFYNSFPLVRRAGELPKDEWPALFRATLAEARHDEALLTHFVACALKATSPGLTGNPSSLPAILEPANIDAMTRFVTAQLGLSSGDGAATHPGASSSAAAVYGLGDEQN